MPQERVVLREIFKSDMTNRSVVVKGWVRSVRKTKKFSFVVLNDGTTFDSLQIIVDATLTNYEEISSMLTGTAIAVSGKLVHSEGKGQQVEMHADSVVIIGPVDLSYPLQKKATSLEYLREQAHLRVRTNTFGAIFRIRHGLAMATHEFFNKRGFFYLNAPIITAQDGEGAGEMFKVTMLDLNNLPTQENGQIDFAKDYFGKETSLTVTGQLEAECFAMGLGAVYTFGPTFRSENSNTARHLSEFWMIEPEVAFADLEEIAKLATDYIKHLIGHALEHYSAEMDFLVKNYCEDRPDHLEILKSVRDRDFVKITYTDAIDILKKSNHKFNFPHEWGDELQSEHERYLTEQHFKSPVIVTDYPKKCKAFYMKLNADGKTVRAMDILVPGVGEIVGGSQREDNLERLQARLKELDMKEQDYWWYLELRKYGSVPHAGFGLGFERALMYITGMSNVRDVIPFPRTPKSVEF